MSRNALQSKSCMIHYSQDPKKREEANRKRRETNIKKYGNKGTSSRKVLSDRVSRFFKKQKEDLNSLDVIYTAAEIIDIMSDSESEYFYQNYLGKAKNRTLLKKNKALFAALLYHTKFLEKYNRYSKVSFSFRIVAVGAYGLKFARSQYCRCGKYIMFDPEIRDIRVKSYCKRPGCFLGPNSKDHYKYVYEDNWEKMYQEKYLDLLASPAMKEKKRRAGRIAYQKRSSRSDTNFHAIGKNETELLNQKEKEIGFKIDRNYTVEGYYPDGYCHETNTIYEVYEKYHRVSSQQEKDIKRQRIIQAVLNCAYEIIWDD